MDKSDVYFETFSAAPKPSRDKIPINIWETVFLEIVEYSSWFLLVIKEGFIDYSSVFELGQH